MKARKKSQPSILKKGKIFHKKIQKDWELNAKDGKNHIEKTISLLKKNKNGFPKRGRMDIFIDELNGFVSIVEIKSTNWDKIKAKNISRLLYSHRSQVWNYIDKYIVNDGIDVCAGIIYPKKPKSNEMKLQIENSLNEYGLQVVWFED